MTWEKLSELIANMTVEQRQTDVTVRDAAENEFYKVSTLDYTNEKEEDTLEPRSPVFGNQLRQM